MYRPAQDSTHAESFFPATFLAVAVAVVAVPIALAAGPGTATSSAGAAIGSAAVATSGYPGSGQMPTDPAEAMSFFERDVGDWDNGPVRYILLDDEAEIWRGLDNDDQRRHFIEWFWLRRDDDTRDQRNPFKEGFYARVATANERFAGFPRGWRSDRGRVWITLGRPTSVRTDMGTELEIWTYSPTGSTLGTVSYLGDFQVAFRRVDSASWEVYSQFGRGAWPPHVLRAFELVNGQAIQDPFLEFRR